MSPKVTVEPIAFPTDPRGLVLEPLGPDDFARQRNAHLVLTVPGGLRGNHFHPLGTEVAAVLGPALVRFREGDGTRDQHVAEGEAYRFVFPAGVAHAMLNTGPGPMIILSFNTHPHDPARPDVVRDVLIEPPAPPPQAGGPGVS